MDRSLRTSTGWFPVVRAADVGTTPVPVGAGGRPFAVLAFTIAGDRIVEVYVYRDPDRLSHEGP